MSSVPLTVVIPSYRSSETLYRCLDSVADQHASCNYELVVVHSGSEPLPVETQDEFRSATFHVVDERWLPGRARNFGIRRSMSDWVLFLDADCIAGPTWIDSMVSAALIHDAVGIGGGVANGTPWQVASWVMHLLEFGEWLPTGQIRGCETFPSCSAIYRRSALLEVGGFPENIFPCEDTILNCRLRRRGYDLLFCPGPSVRHIHHRTIGQILEHSYAHGLTYGYACQHYHLPGHSLTHLNNVATLVGVVTVRFVRAATRLIPRSASLLPVFALTSPLILLALVEWGRGFVRGCRQSVKNRGIYC